MIDNISIYIFGCSEKLPHSNRSLLHSDFVSRALNNRQIQFSMNLDNLVILLWIIARFVSRTLGVSLLPATLDEMVGSVAGFTSRRFGVSILAQICRFNFTLVVLKGEVHRYLTYINLECMCITFKNRIPI